MQSGSAKAYKTVRDNAIELVELNKDLDLLKRKLRDKGSTRIDSTTVLVNVIAEQSLSTQIQINYLEEDAGWYPVYEARLNSDTGLLNLSQKAVIEQYSDEVWNDVKIVLSTSEPNNEMEVPELESNFIGLEPVYERTGRASGFVAQSSGGDENVLEEVVVTGTKASAPSWQGNYSLSFNIPGRISVSNDSDETQRYDLVKYAFNTDLIAQVVPSEYEQAFLAARFTNDKNAVLYGNMMLVYVDGVFMGNAEMPTILPGAEVTLPMGQDRRIDIKVTDLGGQKSNAGIVKKQKTDITDLLFEITNRRSSTAKIEVKGVYPVSKNRSLRVNIGKNATPPTETDVDNQPGLVLWRSELGSGQTWKINYNYSIKYPANKEVVEVYD